MVAGCLFVCFFRFCYFLVVFFFVSHFLLRVILNLLSILKGSCENQLLFFFSFSKQ